MPQKKHLIDFNLDLDSVVLSFGLNLDLVSTPLKLSLDITSNSPGIGFGLDDGSLDYSPSILGLCICTKYSYESIYEW